MKKRILTSLLTIVFVFSMISTSYANENFDTVDTIPTNEVVKVDENEIITEDEIVEEVETEEVSEDETLIEGAGNEATLIENVQVNTIPILRNKEDSFSNQAVSLMSLNDVSLMSEVANPIITGAYAEDFYADATTFEIELYVENMSDTRQKLNLAVVDENDVVIAQQSGVYYQQNGLVYQMKLVKAVDANSDYYIQFSYSGKYELEYEIYDASIYPITDVAIKNVEVINYATNSFRIVLANATVGTQYTLFYEEEWDGASVKKDATVTSDKSLYVEFGDSFAFSDYNYIWLCEYGSTYFSYSNCIDYKALYNFDFDSESGGEISNDGVNCNNYISTTATNTWFGMSRKGFGYQSYSASDVDNINVYMFDMTTGKTVGTMSNVEYYEEYEQINGSVTFSEKLDETHKYIMVFDDGYSIRVDDSFVITSEPKLTNVNPYDMNKEYLQAVPSGTTTFYAYASSYNISDRNNIKVELIDSTGITVATSSYESKTNYFLMTATNALTAGEYTLKATYNNLTCSQPLTVVAGSSLAWQLVFSETAFNGKTYIGAALQTSTLDPANLTYKVVLADGTEKEAEYHRALYTDVNNDKYFVVVVDEELTSLNYDNRATLKMYNGSNLVAPTYDNNVSILSVRQTSSPFIYDEYNITSTTVELFVEGFTTTGIFSMCAYDDLTQTGVAVNAAKSSKTSVTFNKSDLNKINTMYPLGSGYGGSSKEFFIELDGEYLSYIWGGAYDGLGNAILDDTFGFQKAYTGRIYEVLNLPYNTYAYYKLATSESELASKTYQKIDVGLLYQLKNQQGEQTVYAQFKTSGGVESDVQTASINMDTEAPTFDILTNIPKTFVIDEYNEFEVSIGVSTDEAGEVHYNFYDADNNMIGYDRTRSVSSGTSTASRIFYADDYNYEDATKLVIYMTDNAGNKTEEYSFDVSVFRQYTEYTSGETYLKINNETGMIVEAESTGTTIYIPSEIDGVAVTSIGEYAFYDNGEELRISIPESVTSIDEYAFDDLYDFTLLVKENSAAHRFALANDIPFELVTYKKGDILTDGAVNSKDAVKLAQYLAKWDITLTSDEQQAADVVADGAINSKDAVKLAQYLAKWDITLD